LLDTNVPVIVIADERDNESLEIWRERDFRIWRWHENNAPREKEFGEIFNDAPFAPLRRAVAQMHDNEIKIARCESPPLEELAALLFRFDRALNDENPDLQSALGGAYGVLLSLSRLLHEPAEMETGNLENKVARLCAVFEAPELWLSAEARELANQIAARLRELPAQLRAGGVLTKPQLLGELLDNSEGEIAIVLPGRDEASAARAWWKTRLPSSSWTRIHFASAADWMEDYENGAEGGIAHFIVGGWLGKQRMFDLLHARFSPRVSLLLHPFEERWYGFARRRWDAGSTHSEKESAAHWSDWLGLPRGSLHLNSAPTIEENETTAANEESTPDLSSAASETDWFDYELRLNNYKYAGGQSRVGSRAEQIPSRLVVLGSGRWAFVTEFRRLWTLTDWMREENTDAAMKIPRRRIADLHVGDWVLFRTSERDLIREAADRILKKQAQHEARYLAGLWNAKLAEKYAALNFDLHALCRGLHNAGCKRTSQTIRNWIKDDETIGPTDPDDLLRIAIATGDDELTRRFDDVQQAITIVRGAHLSAADAIEKQLHSVLPRLVAARRDENSGALLEFSLPHLGAVVIAQIEEIGPVSQECRLSQCNRLMSEE
jgi:hypothetical protein